MKRVLAGLVALLVSNMAFAEGIKEGVYIGTRDKRLSIDSYINDGTVQYNLFLFAEGDNDYRVSSSSKELTTDQIAIFAQPENPYEETPPSRCRTEVRFYDQRIEVYAGDRCTREEQRFNGDYAFSSKASYIPEKYWGYWGDCEEPAYIQKTTFSADGYYNYGILGFKEEANGIMLRGFSLYEGVVSEHNIRYSFLKNGRVNIEIYYQSTPDRINNQKVCPNRAKATPHKPGTAAPTPRSPAAVPLGSDASFRPRLRG